MNYCTQYKFIPHIMLHLLTTFTPILYANQNQDNWQAYLDGSVGKNTYYLYSQVMSNSFDKKQNYRALDLGAGAGDVDVDLALLGWDVTSVDTSPRSGEIISERMKYINGKFHVHLSDFENPPLNGYYDLVLSFFALPFGDKNNLPMIIENIGNHMKSNALFAVTFFGNAHTFVKNGHAYGMKKNELTRILTSNGLEIRYFLRRHYYQTGANGETVNWDVLDVIAKKL